MIIVKCEKIPLGTYSLLFFHNKRIKSESAADCWTKRIRFYVAFAIAVYSLPVTGLCLSGPHDFARLTVFQSHISRFLSIPHVNSAHNEIKGKKSDASGVSGLSSFGQ